MVNSFAELVKSRRSVRRYVEKPVNRQLIRQCLEAARLAPSAENVQPWRYIIIDEPELISQFAKEAFSGIYFPMKFAAKAPVIIVMLAKLDLLYRYRRQETEEIVFRYPTESYSAYSTFFYPDGAPVQKDILDWISWIEQGGGPVETYNLRGWGILPENNYEKSWVKICEVWNPNNSATWRDDNGDYA